jgi:hypothetical protein
LPPSLTYCRHLTSERDTLNYMRAYLHIPTTPGTFPEGETIWVDTSLNYHVFDFECRLTAPPIPSDSPSSRIPPAVPSPHSNCLDAMFILKYFPSQPWRILEDSSGRSFCSRHLRWEGEFLSRPTDNAQQALHVLGYQYLYSAKAEDGGRSEFVKLLAMTLALS